MTTNLTPPQEPLVSELPTDDERIMEIEGIAPPVTLVPETLPCPVLLEPGLRFGKGVKTQLLFDALKRRAEYYAELDAMTPEQRAEHDAGIAEFKAMLNADGTLTNEDTKLDGWIPVSERMPPEAEYVSVVSRHGEYVSGLVGGEWLELHDGTSFGLDEIVLWMMLPSLPPAPRGVHSAFGLAMARYGDAMQKLADGGD